MAFQLSPGVLVTEKDLTSIIPAVATSTGGFAGEFGWGPVMQPILVSSENELVAQFGRPTDANFKSWFSAANFLAYTNSLYNIRVTGASASNATSAQVGELLSAPVTAAGSGFTDIPTIAITGGTGSGGTATATLKVVGSVTVSSGGTSGWAIDDTLAVNIGSGVEATFKVAGVNNGVITSVSIVNAGNYTDIIVGSLSSVTATKTSGAGVGTVTLGLTLGLNTVTVSGGSYTVAPTLSANGSQGGSGSTIGTVILATLSTTVINNLDSYNSLYAGGAGEVGLFAAKYPGKLGNSIRISFADSATYSDWVYQSEFDGAPGTSSYVSDKGGSNDELHIIVIDNDGLISNTAGTILEKFAYVSKASDARKTDGTNNYYKDVLNTLSQYVWWMDHLNAGWGTAAASTSFASMSTAVNSVLSGGADGSAPTEGDIEAGYDLLSNAEQYDISLIVTGAVTPATSAWIVQNVAEVRKDALAFVSPSTVQGGMISGADILGDMKTFRSVNFNVNSSYSVLDSGWKYQYDRYNDKYRWVPLNGDIAGLCARTDYTNDPWWSPGGLNRGQVKNVVKLSFSPTKAQRDEIYKIGINPVVAFPGQGTVLYGDKTTLSKPSAFDRINVRRLFIVLEKAIATAAKYQLFEFNDSFTRAQFRSMVEPFLRDVQGRRGVTDFRVICDETNNTGEVIDGNSFVADIYIKPARAINFITLNFIAARTGISFDEIGG